MCLKHRKSGLDDEEILIYVLLFSAGSLVSRGDPRPYRERSRNA